MEFKKGSPIGIPLLVFMLIALIQGCDNSDNLPVNELIANNLANLSVHEEINNNKANEEGIEFFYTIALLNFKDISDSENFNELNINKTHVNLRHKFTTPSSCSNMNYTLLKENFTLSILPKLVPYSPIIDPETGKVMYVGCGAMLSVDFVEINLTLSPGTYFLRVYNFYEHETPESIFNISIETY